MANYLDEIVQSFEMHYFNDSVDRPLYRPLTDKSEAQALREENARLQDKIDLASEDQIKYKRIIDETQITIARNRDRIREIEGGFDSVLSSHFPVISQQNISLLNTTKQTLERDIGLPIDTTSYVIGMHPLTLFESREVLEAFRTASRVFNVSTEYVARIVFREIGEKGGEYHRKTESIRLSEDVTREFITDGGLYQVWARSFITEVFGQMHRTITNVPVEFKDALTDSYEEVAVHKLALNLVNDKTKYRELLKKQYDIHSQADADNLIKRLFNTGRNISYKGFRHYLGMDKVAQAMAVFHEIDRGTYALLDEAFAKAEFSPVFKEAIRDLERLYSSINLEHVYSSIDVAAVQAYGINQLRAVNVLKQVWAIEDVSSPGESRHPSGREQQYTPPPIRDRPSSSISPPRPTYRPPIESVAEGGAGASPPPRRPDQDYLRRLRQRKESLEKTIGLTIDVDTYAGGSLNPLLLFQHDSVLETFRKAAKGIRVSENYLKGIVFVNAGLKTDDERISELLSQLTPDIPMAYDLNSRKIYTREDVPLNFIINGGLYHEWGHGKIAQDFGDPIRTITNVPMQFRDAISDCYEEVAAHKITYTAVKKNRRTTDIFGKSQREYIEMLRDKYKIHSQREAKEFVENSISTDEIIIGGRSFSRIDKLAECLAIFSSIDKKLYAVIKAEVGKIKLQVYEREAIDSLEKIYSSIDTNNKVQYTSNLSGAVNALLKGWNV